jgi:hypothetical protein
MTKYEPLTRDEVVSVIAGKSQARRVPVFIHFWVHPGEFGDKEPAVREILRRFPQDFQLAPCKLPSLFRGQFPDAPEYSWLPWEPIAAGGSGAIDSNLGLPDWTRIDEVIEKFPDPDYPGLWEYAPGAPDGRYRLAQWFFCLFERHWSLRGMSNALTDYYVYPDEVHRLFDALTRFYCRVIERAGREKRCDGVWTSDDLGTQTGEFFSPGIFRAFYKPYYKRMADAAHANGMTFWMHACGNIMQFIPEWIETGLDVLHPIQKHTMDETEVARRFGDRLTIFAGMDVQQVIPWGTSEEVRKEVRFLMDAYWRPGEGRCMITAGNGINGDCPLASLEAFLDESFSYGSKVVSSRRK